MKFKPLYLYSYSGGALTDRLVRAMSRTGRVVGDAAGTGVGVGMKMSLGVVLATLVPQLSLAQDEPSASRQPIKHSRKADQSQRPENNAQKMAPALRTIEFTKKAVPKRADVVDAVPRLNEKYLTPDELRVLRKQLLEQR